MKKKCNVLLFRQKKGLFLRLKLLFLFLFLLVGQTNASTNPLRDELSQRIKNTKLDVTEEGIKAGDSSNDYIVSNGHDEISKANVPTPHVRNINVEQDNKIAGTVLDADGSPPPRCYNNDPWINARGYY